METEDIKQFPLNANDDSVMIDKRPFTIVKEGQANVDFPSALDVFYNPVQEFNRDLRYLRY